MTAAKVPGMGEHTAEQRALGRALAKVIIDARREDAAGRRMTIDQMYEALETMTNEDGQVSLAHLAHLTLNLAQLMALFAGLAKSAGATGIDTILVEFSAAQEWGEET